MEVTSLREPKMADRVATVLRRMFIRGEITEGTMLPPESELMERFGVSRPTLREAFRVLESESLIQVQRGVRGGARVTRPRRETLARYAGLILEYEGVRVKDVYDARVTLEVPMVEQLAKDRNPKVIAELEQIVRRLEAGQVKLDDAIQCYERGAQLKSHCEQKLNEAQQRVDRGRSGAARHAALLPPGEPATVCVAVGAAQVAGRGHVQRNALGAHLGYVVQAQSLAMGQEFTQRTSIQLGAFGYVHDLTAR